MGKSPEGKSSKDREKKRNRKRSGCEKKVNKTKSTGYSRSQGCG